MRFTFLTNDFFFQGAVINPSEEDSQTFVVSAMNGEIYRLRGGCLPDFSLPKLSIAEFLNTVDPDERAHFVFDFTTQYSLYLKVFQNFVDPILSFARSFCCIPRINDLSRDVRKPTFWFPTWSNTSKAVQLQKMARALKFLIWKEGSYYLCSENKGADHLRGYREADLRLCFRMCKMLVFS